MVPIKTGFATTKFELNVSQQQSLDSDLLSLGGALFSCVMDASCQEFFKMAPDVVERRTKGLEMYITTIIRRFPDMLESSQLDR